MEDLPADPAAVREVITKRRRASLRTDRSKADVETRRRAEARNKIRSRARNKAARQSRRHNRRR